RRSRGFCPARAPRPKAPPSGARMPPADRARREPKRLSRSFQVAERAPSDPGSSMGRLGLTLITGPANAGKVALLLRRYLDALPREPFLIVPNRPDVDRAERDLLELQPALLGGTIGTFDDLFQRIAREGGAARRVVSDGQ